MKFFCKLISFWVALLAAPNLYGQFEVSSKVYNQLDSRKAGAQAVVSGAGEVTSILIRGGGQGYVSSPLITIGPGTSSTATAIVEVSSGVVTDVRITSGGGGYDPDNPPVVTVGLPVLPIGNPTITPQFSGFGVTSGGSNAISLNGAINGGLPRAIDDSDPSTDITTMVLQQSSFGNSFASGVPLYSIGDVILRPQVTWNGTFSSESYWRPEPVRPGETFNGEVYLDNLDVSTEPVISAGSVTVLNASTTGDSTDIVTVSSVPVTLSSGATLLGQRVHYIKGNNVYLAGPADQDISSSTVVQYYAPQTFHYSMHANKVFASHTGRVSVTWVSNLPDTSAPGETSATYKFRTEVFSVASTPRQPSRKIYWTEKTYSGPRVQIPEGRIKLVNVVYNQYMTSHVATEYNPNPESTIAPGLTSELRTLWFDNQYEASQLRAYNNEGSVFVEYLGSQASDGSREFLGADVISVEREMKSVLVDTILGEQLRPREGPPQAGDDALLPTFSRGSKSGLYNQSVLANGKFVYHAEQESLTSDNIEIFWSKENDVAIHFLEEPARPGLALEWPVRRTLHRQIWPDFYDFYPVVVSDAGTSIGNGPIFDTSQVPVVVFQDDVDQEEVTVDSTTGLLTVDFSDSDDKTSRALLKFTSATQPWYLPVYIQSEDVLGTPEQIITDSTTGITETIEAVPSINDLDADGVKDHIYSAVVGDRISPPSDAYSVAGYIASGDIYYEAGYINPFDEGIAAAEMGAIIPVNALTGTNTLKVWWFKDVPAPSDQFSTFDLPAIVAEYTVHYPTDAPQIVIASGMGTGDLGSAQASGSVYYQNDDTKTGFNPNEEHALLLSGRAYALRDDLHTAATSEPFVLIAYTDSVDARPSMEVYEVLRETEEYPLTYDAIAGSKVAMPAPLLALPLPMEFDGITVANSEVDTNTDIPSNSGSPTHYSSFTVEDRQGFHWIYRGAHSSAVTAQASATINSSGQVTGVSVDTAGSAYSAAPNVSIRAPETGTTATATATLNGNGSIASISVVDAGSGYAEAPTITIEPPVSFGMHYYYKSLAGFYDTVTSNEFTVDTLLPFIADEGTSTPVTLTYVPKWPDDSSLIVANRKTVGVLQTAQTLTLATDSAVAGSLPQVRGASSAQIVYQQSIANGTVNDESVVLHDATRAKYSYLDADSSTVLNELPASIATTLSEGLIYFQGLPPHLQSRFYFNPSLGTSGALVLKGEFVDVVSGEDYLNLNLLAGDNLEVVKDLCQSADTDKTAWDDAIEGLSTNLETFIEDSDVPGTYEVDSSFTSVVDFETLPIVTDPDIAVDSYALTATGNGTGYVTLLFENGEAFTDPGNPISMQVIKVDASLYAGDIKTLLASNPLDEQVTLRHSGDYGGNASLYDFEWRYGFPDDGGTPVIDDDSIDDASSTSTWLKPNGTLSEQILVGGSPTATISNPAVLVGDTYFTMNYRLKDIGDGSTPGDWSGWTSPVLVEGWIKRVLAGINPFDQRMSDLSSNSVNTDVSLLTQAGTRWEGDIALNLNSINDFGLIQIYETVLNRAKSFTIGSNIDFTTANSALILAAGYLNDLYSLLGDEAYSDAANPTISIDSGSAATEVNTSRFCFEGQVASALEEELALLKGRDDTLSTGVAAAPAYNRLYWNYTGGISSGEVFYATNYNINEAAGDSTEDGVINEYDAQRMFPQGHGDAYGHYLTALKGYYELLFHPYFSWTTSSESVSVFGQTVQIDYKDERKFAASAADLASTAEQIVALIHRQNYRDADEGGWSHYRDGYSNSRSGIVRHQGLDEWVSRAAQGSYLNWITGNTMLPTEDTDPNHSGVQVIDRTTVPELNQLIASARVFQNTIDNACSGLNPLGLSADAIAFDISPDQLRAGESHFEQIYQRALQATLNAEGAFTQAAGMTRLLRNQDNEIVTVNYTIEAEESLFDNQLIDILGTPYSGDFGAGKTYSSDYVGPDLYNWNVVDKPSGLVDTGTKQSVTVYVPTEVKSFTIPNNINNLNAFFDGSDQLISTEERTLEINPNSYLQWVEDFWSGSAMGSRGTVGTLQMALLEAYQAEVQLSESWQALQVLHERLDREQSLISELLQTNEDKLVLRQDYKTDLMKAVNKQASLENDAEQLYLHGELFYDYAEAFKEYFPESIGTSNDPTSPARGNTLFVGSTLKAIFSHEGLNASRRARRLNDDIEGHLVDLELPFEELDFNFQEKQVFYEYELLYRDVLSAHFEMADLAAELQLANEQVRNLIAEKDTILASRTTFRKRAAAQIAGYRTNDYTFRAFRNEALEQYRSLFDLASRYVYLAAKSYDYETGLLGSDAGHDVFSKIVASRALGDLSNGQPQATVSSLGDSGLAGTLAQLNADFSVAEGRLGINNPDTYGTLFSLRKELYRILDDDSLTSDDDAWKQALEMAIVPDLLSDPDVAQYCNNLQASDGTNVPGIILSFNSSIQHGRNFFGLDIAAGDHFYTPSSYATKINSVGVVFEGYEGMDLYGAGSESSNVNSPNALSSTPYVYLIPCGTDFMLAPPLGDTNTLRSWTVHDQAMPLPYNLGENDFNTLDYVNASGSLTEEPWIQRKHQAFRAVNDPAVFYGLVPTEFTNSRLIGRSVWNGQWKLVIPANTLLSDEQTGLDRFVDSVDDIKLFLRTYSNSGN